MQTMVHCDKEIVLWTFLIRELEIVFGKKAIKLKVSPCLTLINLLGAKIIKRSRPKCLKLIYRKTITPAMGLSVELRKQDKNTKTNYPTERCILSTNR